MHYLRTHIPRTALNPVRQDVCSRTCLSPPPPPLPPSLSCQNDFAARLPPSSSSFSFSFFFFTFFFFFDFSSPSSEADFTSFSNSLLLADRFVNRFFFFLIRRRRFCFVLSASLLSVSMSSMIFFVTNGVCSLTVISSSSFRLCRINWTICVDVSAGRPPGRPPCLVVSSSFIESDRREGYFCRVEGVVVSSSGLFLLRLPSFAVHDCTGLFGSVWLGKMS